MGRVDHDALAALDTDVDPDVRHVRGTVPEEDEVAGLEWRVQCNLWLRVALLLGGAGKGVPRATLYAAWCEPGAVGADP